MLMIDLQDRLGRFAPAAGVTYSAHINAPEKAVNAAVVATATPTESVIEAKPIKTEAPAKYVLGARG